MDITPGQKWRKLDLHLHGAIEREDVREEIILHLEGGNRSFELKTKKYKNILKINEYAH